MTPDELAAVVREVLAEAVRAGEVPDPGPVDAPVRVSPHGWTTPLALRVASAVRMPVRQVAAALADRLAEVSGIETVSVQDGFITVTPRSLVAAVARALAEGQAYGCSPGDRLGPPGRWVSAAAMPRTLDNPVFVVQLARARLARQGLGSEPAVTPGELTTPGTTETPEPLAAQPDPPWAAVVAEFPGVARRAAAGADPEVLARFLEKSARLALAGEYVDPELAAGLAVVLRNGLEQLGTAAPDRV